MHMFRYSLSHVDHPTTCTYVRLRHQSPNLQPQEGWACKKERPTPLPSPSTLLPPSPLFPSLLPPPSPFSLPPLREGRPDPTPNYLPDSQTDTQPPNRPTPEEAKQHHPTERGKRNTTQRRRRHRAGTWISRGHRNRCEGTAMHAAGNVEIDPMRRYLRFRQARMFACSITDVPWSGSAS